MAAAISPGNPRLWTAVPAFVGTIVIWTAGAVGGVLAIAYGLRAFLRWALR